MALSPRQLFTSLQIVLRFLLFLTPRRRPPTSPSTRMTSDRRIPRLSATFLTASPFDARSLHFTFVSVTFLSRFDHTFIRHSKSPPHLHLQSSGYRTRIPMHANLRLLQMYTPRGVCLWALTFLKGAFFGSRTLGAKLSSR